MYSMNHGLFARIQSALERTGKTGGQLEDCLRENELYYSLPYVETFAEPGDIILIATFLEVRASHLLQATSYKESYVRALFEETWPDHKDTVGASKEEVWNIVVKDWQRRGESPHAGVEQNMELILDGLRPPDRSTVACQYPDCPSTGRCHITGHMLEPGDWP